MKLNWGHYILIFFICYISLLIYTVIKSRSIDHSLVADNYYQYDINYQKQFDAVTNRKYLKEDLQIYQDNENQTLILDFGEEKVNLSGQLSLYRADDQSKDIIIDFTLIEQNTYSYPLINLHSGRWKVKVEWSDKNRKYYKDQSIYL